MVLLWFVNRKHSNTKKTKKARKARKEYKPSNELIMQFNTPNRAGRAAYSTALSLASPVARNPLASPVVNPGRSQPRLHVDDESIVAATVLNNDEENSDASSYSGQDDLRSFSSTRKKKSNSSSIRRTDSGGELVASKRTATQVRVGALIR